jgi:hypothetical protein
MMLALVFSKLRSFVSLEERIWNWVDLGSPYWGPE